MDGSMISIIESVHVQSAFGGRLYALDALEQVPRQNCRQRRNTPSQPDNIDGPGIIAPCLKVSSTNDTLSEPGIIFTRLTVACVGLTRGRAEVAGSAGKIRGITAMVTTLGAKLHQDGYQDEWAQWIPNAESNKLLGATLVGDGVAELLRVSTEAIMGGLTVQARARCSFVPYKELGIPQSTGRCTRSLLDTECRCSGGKAENDGSDAVVANNTLACQALHLLFFLFSFFILFSI